ncbi:MAG: hypothetical protein WC482_01335 [Candidatus Omnitrophota bacterium]|jgi:hypothetical protein|nr:hypothetical protein [Candidatus Omnitrophota bacterium]
MVERSDYNGKPILVLRRSEDDKFPFSFGINKAKLILENLEEIKKFVAENTQE